MKGYQLKITIKGSKPPMWRRILIPETATFRNLHQVIQEAFGWSGYHLHEFEFSRKKLLIRDMSAQSPADQEGCSLLDEQEPINRLLEENPRFLYTYDFKDRWEHQILFEKEAECSVPQVIKAKGGNLPENSGGIKAFLQPDQELPSDKDYPLEAVNQRLEALFSAAAEPAAETAKAAVFVKPSDPCPCRSGKRYRQCCGRAAYLKRM